MPEDSRWQRPKPREVLTSRVKPEYQAGLNALWQQLRHDERFSGIEKYDILEHLLTPLLTAEGRSQVKRELER